MNAYTLKFSKDEIKFKFFLNLNMHLQLYCLQSKFYNKYNTFSLLISSIPTFQIQNYKAWKWS